MHFTKMNIALAGMAMLGAMAPATAPAQAASVASGYVASAAAAAIDKAAETIITVRRDDGEYRAVRKNGEIIVTRNGEVLPEDQIARNGRRIRVIDEDGNIVLRLALDPHSGSMIMIGERDRTAQAPRGQIGVALSKIDESLAGHLGLDPDEGVLITNVVEGGGADKAGLRKHDIILAVNDQRPVSIETLRSAVRDTEPGEHITLEIMREGQRKTMDVNVQPFREREVRRLRGADAADLAERLQMFFDQQDFERYRDDAVRLAEEAMREIERHSAQLRERSIELPAQLRQHLVRGEEAIGELRITLEHEINALLEAAEALTEDIDENLEQMLDRIEAHIRALFIERPALLGLSRQMELVEDEDGGKSIVVRPHRGGAGGYVVPQLDRAEVEQARRRQLGGGGGAMPRERAERQLFEQRLNQLEQRLERIEAMLHQLTRED